MQRRYPLAAVAVLAVLAALLWIREPPDTDRSAEWGRSTEQPLPTEALELASPIDPAPDEFRTEASEPFAAESQRSVARATWTGVRVRVTAIEDDRPLAGIDVRARPDDVAFQFVEYAEGIHAALGESATTQDAGVAELELSPGRSWSIHASSRSRDVGFGSLDLDSPLEMGEIREVTIRLPTTLDLVLFGRVVDAETNLPLARVRVGPADGWGNIRSDDDQVTDSDGRFRVQGASWKRVVANVIASGYELACVAIVTGYETREQALEVQIGRTGTAHVVLLDRDGFPMARHRVLISADKNRFARPLGAYLGELPASKSLLLREDQNVVGPRVEWVEVTNEAGEAVFADVPPRMPLDLAAMRDDSFDAWHLAQPFVLEPGETRTIKWRIGSGCTLRGIALESDGQPAAQLEIALEPAVNASPAYFERVPEPKRRIVIADAVGRFEFADVGAGAWLIGPAPSKSDGGGGVRPRDVAPYGQVVRIEPHVTQVDVTINVHRGLWVEGRILDPGGQPTSGRVLFFDDDGAFLSTNTKEPKGPFKIGPLRAGACELMASGSGSFSPSMPLRAAAGDHDLVLRLRAGAGMRVMVVDRSNGSPCQADVLVRADSTGSWVMRDSPDSSGAVRFDGLDPGTYSLSATTPDGRVGVLTGVELDQGKIVEGLRVEVEPGARLRVRHAGQSDYLQIEVITSAALIADDALEPGDQRVFVAPAGHVVLRASTYPGPKQFDLPLTLAVGETRDLVFDGTWR